MANLSTTRAAIEAAFETTPGAGDEPDVPGIDAAVATIVSGISAARAAAQAIDNGTGPRPFNARHRITDAVEQLIADRVAPIVTALGKTYAIGLPDQTTTKLSLDSVLDRAAAQIGAGI